MTPNAEVETPLAARGATPRGAFLLVPAPRPTPPPKREFFIDNLLVRIHFIIVMIRWTGLAPGSLDSPKPQTPNAEAGERDDGAAPGSVDVGGVWYSSQFKNNHLAEM